MITGYIYETTNNITGETYIGQHKTINGRIDSKYLGSGVYLHQMIRKYGRDNFSQKILYQTDDMEQLSYAELSFILKAKQEGKAEYNMRIGAQDASAGFWRIDEKFAKEVYKRAAEGRAKTYAEHPEILEKWKQSINKHYAEHPETKEQISQTLKKYFETHENPNKGKTFSDEVRKKVSERTKEAMARPEIKAKVDAALEKCHSREAIEKARKTRLESNAKLTAEERKEKYGHKPITAEQQKKSQEALKARMDEVEAQINAEGLITGRQAKKMFGNGCWPKYTQLVKKYGQMGAYRIIGEKKPHEHKPFSEETKRKISEALIGKHYHTEESKQKLREAAKGNRNNLGRHWYTNGVENKLLSECPDGWRPGMVPRKK